MKIEAPEEGEEGGAGSRKNVILKDGIVSLVSEVLKFNSNVTGTKEIEVPWLEWEEKGKNV